MATTTFLDIKFTEKVENYRYEKQEYSFDEGETVALPLHTAMKFVNSWNRAEFASDPYEVKQQDYDDIVCKKRKKADAKGDDETCDEVKSDGEVCGREKPCPYHDDE